jgi:hypothetical protein
LPARTVHSRLRMQQSARGRSSRECSTKGEEEESCSGVRQEWWVGSVEEIDLPPSFRYLQTSTLQ